MNLAQILKKDGVDTMLEKNFQEWHAHRDYFNEFLYVSHAEEQALTNAIQALKSAYQINHDASLRMAAKIAQRKIMYGVEQEPGRLFSEEELHEYFLANRTTNDFSFRLNVLTVVTNGLNLPIRQIAIPSQKTKRAAEWTVVLHAKGPELVNLKEVYLDADYGFESKKDPYELSLEEENQIYFDSMGGYNPFEDDSFHND